MLEIIKQEAQWPPESTAAIRHEMMTKERVKPYYQSLKWELYKNELVYIANVIWNMDETIITFNLATDAKNCWKVQKHTET